MFAWFICDKLSQWHVSRLYSVMFLRLPETECSFLNRNLIYNLFE